MAEVAITVYTREDCHLCEAAIETIERVANETEMTVDIDLVDVDTDPQLRSEYGERVPYVLLDGTPAFKYRIDESELRQTIGADTDRK